ncbi:hypothetical protein SCUCBS95973_001346 [Sporothrix curviconia]|uniref:DNA repair protein n=1 Tax=Sporothrix curviconia TaxID=1260050 RepID=A0ABP0AY10_9PEZI
MDDFSDDGFDDLNLAVLQELETKALQSFQTQQQAFGQPQNGREANADDSDFILIDDVDPDVHEDVDKADAAVLRELARVPAQLAYGGRLTAAAAPPPLPLPAYSQRSLVNVPLPPVTNNSINHAGHAGHAGHANHNTNAPSSVNARHGSFYPRPSQQRPAATTMPSSQVTRPMAPPRPSIPIRQGAGPGPGPNPITGLPMAMAAGSSDSDNSSVASLQARIRALETDLLVARGKASMMENKNEVAQRKHTAEIARIKAEKDEELSKLRQRAEAAVAAHKSAATELEFAKQDLKEEVEKSKKGRRTDRVDNPTTPRKNTAGRSNWNVADGFEDVELLPSPSKGFGRRLKEAGVSVTPAVERTPKKGKRRRNITDSPTKPLETVAAEDEDVFSGSPGMPASASASKVLPPPSAKEAPEDSPFVFIQEVLGHQSQPGEPTTIELFSRYSFPSNKKQSLAFLMLQRIPSLEGTQGTAQLMLDFCQLVLGIWSQCLREQYYAPIRAIVSLMSYILMRNPIGLVPHIMVYLVPIAQETVYLVAAPTFGSPASSLANHPDYNMRQLASDIDAGATMALLQLAAFGCLSQEQGEDNASATQNQPSQMPFSEMHRATQTWFWSVMQFEFVLLMLSSKQAPDAFLSMLSLLRTSALPDSIGPITNDPARDASVVASLIIDRISHHIEEPPKWASNSKYTEWDVRLAALGVLDCFAQSPFGRLSLAASDCTLPRLVGALFPAYGELRERDLLDEPMHPPDDLLCLSESEIRAYGIGGLDLAQSLGFQQDSTTWAVTAIPTNIPRVADASNTSNATSSQTSADAAHRPDRNATPLILLYVSSVVYLLHSILTDPYTAPVANILAKLGDAPNNLQGFYLLTMARLGFCIEPVLSVGLPDETYKLAMELFKLVATPEEDAAYAEWARLTNEAQRTDSSSRQSVDPFSNNAIGEKMDVDMSIVKVEKAVP